MFGFSGKELSDCPTYLEMYEYVNKVIKRKDELDKTHNITFHSNKMDKELLIKYLENGGMEELTAFINSKIK